VWLAYQRSRSQRLLVKFLEHWERSPYSNDVVERKATLWQSVNAVRCYEPQDDKGDNIIVGMKILSICAKYL
jgi:hypothetical protein